MAATARNWEKWPCFAHAIHTDPHINNLIMVFPHKIMQTIASGSVSVSNLTDGQVKSPLYEETAI